ncbi:hypothetical protein, partial [Bradyrhizobium sp. UNPF46]|uniref:hypothetical protein n=1 Tax=Bradyrhizobium sp. UNPF46 TaxID=1141168 RepID=UPI001AED4B88
RSDIKLPTKVQPKRQSATNLPVFQQTASGDGAAYSATWMTVSLFESGMDPLVYCYQTGATPCRLTFGDRQLSS